jgi:hypothetical protein
MKSNRFLSIVLPILVLVAFGCGGKTDAGAKAGGKLPDDFASVFPLPSGTVVTHMAGAPMAKTFEATFSAPGSADDIKDFYTRELSSGGWSLNPSTVSATAWMDNSRVYSSTARGHGYFVTVTIDKGNGPKTHFKATVGIGR